MSKDTIYRQDAIDAIDKIFPADPMRNEYTQGITCGAALATEYIKQLPAAQPDVQKMQDLEQAEIQKAYELGKLDAMDEIVKCKDCKHKHIENSVFVCPFGLPGGPEFFCGYGSERQADK